MLVGFLNILTTMQNEFSLFYIGKKGKFKKKRQRDYFNEKRDKKELTWKKGHKEKTGTRYDACERSKKHLNQKKIFKFSI